MNGSMNGETSETAADWTPPRKPEQRPGRVVFWLLVILAVAATVAGLGFSRASVHPYSDSATSMEPTIMPGHQLYVAEGRDVRRGPAQVERAAVHDQEHDGRAGGHDGLQQRQLAVYGRAAD